MYTKKCKKCGKEINVPWMIEICEECKENNDVKKFEVKND